MKQLFRMISKPSFVPDVMANIPVTSPLMDVDLETGLTEEGPMFDRRNDE